MAPPTPQAMRPLLTVGQDMPKLLASVTLFPAVLGCVYCHLDDVAEVVQFDF